MIDTMTCFAFDSADKMYALGWIFGETIVIDDANKDATITVTATKRNRKSLLFVKRVLKLHGKPLVSSVLTVSSAHVIEAMQSLTFDLLVQSPFFVDFCTAVIDKYGVMMRTNMSIVIDTPTNVPEMVMNHFDIKVSKQCHGFFVIEGVAVLDALCPIYRSATKRSFSPIWKSLKRHVERPLQVDTVLEKDAIMPTKAHFTDAGLDLSIISEYQKIDDRTSLYDTGVRIQPPLGYWTAIFPRSSISKSGFIVHNSVGVVDVSYRGTILIALTRVAAEATIVFPFKCAQMILIPQVFAECRQVQSLDSTRRGSGGYGSSDAV